MIVFWSQSASKSDWIKSEISKAASGIEDLNDRVLFALLDKAKIPDFWMEFKDPAVQLYGDEKRSSTNRIDDLMVRLYWLIYRKTEYGKLK